MFSVTIANGQSFSASGQPASDNETVGASLGRDSWSTSDPTVAIVKLPSKTGQSTLVQSVGVGTTMITISGETTDGPFSSEFQLIVVDTIVGIPNCTHFNFIFGIATATT